MAYNRSKLVEKIVKASIVGGLSLLSVVSNGQKVKEDINWTKVKEPYGKYTLTIRSTNSLPELSKYQNVNREPYLPYGNLNLPYKYNYKIPQDSIKGDVSKYLKKIDVCPDCTKTKKSVSIKKKTSVKPVTTKKTPTKPITPQKSTAITPVDKTPEKKTEEPYVPKTSENGKPSTIYNVNETNTINNTTNNYYGDTTKTKQEQQKLSSLELRTLIEGTKSFNIDGNLMNNIEGISVNPQIVFGPVGIGPYGKYNIGNRKSSVITDVYERRLLNQALGLSTETEGVEIEDSNTKYHFEFGGVLSLNLTKDGRLRFDMSYGKINKRRITNGVHGFGFDRKLLGDEVIINDNGEREEKPYDFTSDEGMTYNSLEDIQKAGITGEPFKNSGFYIGVEGQYIGKLNAANLKKENLSVNAKLGWRIGGGKKAK